MKTLTKEEAIKFAKKYLEDRMNERYIGECSGIRERAWKIAIEYVILDVIPHIYGEALD